MSLVGGFASAGAPSSGEGALPPSKDLPPADAFRAYYVVLEGPAAIEVAPHDPEAFVARRREIGAAQARIEAALPSVGARLFSRYSRLVNALQVIATEEGARRLASLPGVVRVERVPVVGRANASAVPYVGGQKVWSSFGITGKGVRVGIIDTGVDYLHADFGGPGTPQAYKANDPKIVEPGTFPTKKVAGGVDLVGDAYDPSSGVLDAVPDPDPLDCAGMQMMNISGGHGTHVAGSVAGKGVTADGKAYDGPYDLSPNLLSFRVGPGVAPEATLYAIKIFGCEGATTAVTDALEWAVDPNDDGDTSDRLDVLNLSLGGSYGLPTATDETAVKNLVAAGSFLAIAAGNDGDATFVTGAPGTYSEVLSVAAVTDVISFRTLTVTAPSSIAGDKAAAEGAFTKSLGLTGPVSGELVATVPANGCGTISNASALKGKIAFIRRGSCTFVSKFQSAIAAGAVAAVVADQMEADEPFSMGGDGTQSSIPGVMIRKVDGDPIAEALAGGQKVTVVLDGGKAFPSKTAAGELAGFSSRGPRSLDLKLKPEIAAPGVGIDSAGVGSGAEPRDLSGTSMATPMVAGAAALLRAAHPERTPYEVKSLLMGAALPAIDTAGNEANVARGGAGRLAIDRAVAATFAAHVDDAPGDVAVSFGGRVAFDPYTVEKTVVVDSFGAAALTLSAETAFTNELPGVTVQVSPKTLTVPAGGKGTLTLTLSVDPKTLGAPPGDSTTPPTTYGQPRQFLTEASGFLTLTAASGETTRVPFHGAMRAASRRKANLVAGCSGPDTVEIPITGESAHPSPSTMLLELGGEEPAKEGGAATDIVAIGAATNLPTAETFADSSIYFGVAVSGEWITPTFAQLSVVSIEIDVNDDGKADFRVNVEPYSKDQPYADVLVAQTYKASGTQVESKRFLNIVPRTSADTAPFMNGAVVLPVTTKALGLTEGAAKVKYRARTQGVSKGGEVSSWASFDMEHPKVQPVGGIKVVDKQIETAVFAGDMKLKAKVDRSAGPVSALLLHLMNEAGARAEVVSLDAKTTGVSLSVTPPAAPVTGDAQFVVTVDNAGEASVDAYEVKLSALGGTIVSVSGGTCAASSTSCVVPSIAAKSKATLVVTARPTGTSPKITLSATGQCADAKGDVGVATPPSLAVSADAGPTPSGGCACEVPSGPRGASAWAALVGLGAVGLLRRRRAC